MQLKNYHQQALEQLDRWLDALKESRKETADAKEFYAQKRKPIPEALKNYPHSAWQNLKEQNVLPGIPQNGDMVVPEYISRAAASGEPIPHICLKVPTGGGKTLLGVAALERVKQETGFVLWIVPTRAIYEQTIKAFRTREHPYRQTLERISGGKVKLLQKTDRFTKQDTESYLCIMMLMLPSANRQKNKDFLKIFRDSGGYMSFFPEQEDAIANRKLSEQHLDLEKSNSGDCVKQSLINVLKLIRPTVILDEAHKAYGKNDDNNKQFVKSVNRLNPRFVLELSATPKIGISNIMVNTSGTDLQDEEMIKLPIEIHSFSNSDWKHTLAKTQEKLDELESAAQKLQEQENRYIRPIALVRVQRTGKDQRQQRYIHSEDAREYLIRNLAVPENQIKIQSSEQKELAGEDLLSEMSFVRWIITKDALKEGWDCSFAYVLALLDNTTATTAMTQMVGRVMRQPQARRIKKHDSLNQCYIYCYNQDVGKAVTGIKAGLENEGLTGLGDSVHGYGGTDAAESFIKQHRNRGHDDLKLLNSRIYLAEVLRRRVKDDIDDKAESVFRDKVGQNEIRFHLETDERLDYELSKSFEVFVSSQERSLQSEHGKPIQQNLFEPVYESSFNGLERDFALYLDKSDAIYWWHRVAARQAYYLQGWRRHRVYPDFVACRKDNGKLLILETKGIHLKGSEDTSYKKKLLDTLEKTYRIALDRGEMMVNEPSATFSMMFEDTWKEQASELIE